MPLVGGIVAALLGEAEIIFGGGGFVRSGGRADAVPPCIACRSAEASREPPVPVQVQRVVGAAASARFDIHLRVAVAELTLDVRGTGCRIHRDHGNELGDRMLKRIPTRIANVDMEKSG